MSEHPLSILLPSVVPSLKSIIVQTFACTSGLKAQILQLESSLDAIGAVLRDAEEKPQRSEAVKEWLFRLRYVAYEASDVIEQFSIEAVRRQNLQNSRRGVPVLAELFFLPHQRKFRRELRTKLRAVKDRLDLIVRDNVHLHLSASTLPERSRETISFLVESKIIGRDDEFFFY